IRAAAQLRLLGSQPVAFTEARDLLFLKTETLPRHSNGMRFTAFTAAGKELSAAEFYSIGGGFIVRGDEASDGSADGAVALPYDFNSADELLALCRQHALPIHELVLANEKAWRSEAEIRQKLLAIWQVMQDCVARGTREEGVLPGGLKVRRRAARLLRALNEQQKTAPLDIMDWINLFAMAVNEENAAGGRVVTAPTNGAAGIIPAVLHYY